MLFAYLFTANIILIDLKNFSWSAQLTDQSGLVVTVAQGKASGGRRFCPDIERSCKTPSGIFSVIVRRGKHYRSPLYPLGCRGNQVPRCAPMPFYVKFRHSGEGIHGSNDDWRRPKHQSHGCVHVSRADAEWIHDFVDRGTKIVILPY